MGSASRDRKALHRTEVFWPPLLLMPHSGPVAVDSGGRHGARTSRDAFSTLLAARTSAPAKRLRYLRPRQLPLVFTSGKHQARPTTPAVSHSSAAMCEPGPPSQHRARAESQLGLRCHKKGHRETGFMLNFFNHRHYNHVKHSTEYYVQSVGIGVKRND